MTSWHTAIADCEREHTAYAIATIVATTGSAPRQPGGKMVITAERQFDTIGGGQFERLIIERARSLLAQNGERQHLDKYPLAAAANQCCGGSISVLIETFEVKQPVVIFGAGHVAQRVAQLFDDLPTHLTVVDSRADWLAGCPADRHIEHAQPDMVCEQLLPGGYNLVMTHDHTLDYAIIQALLTRGDQRFIGLIGSATKWQNFSRRLRRDGYSDAQLACVRCPVGSEQVPGKEPMAVAVSIVAEYLNLRHTLTQPSNNAAAKSSTPT